MPEYIRHDKDGNIIQKWYSVDHKVIDGLPNILKIPRDEFKSLTRWHKVKDGKVVEMTQEEKDVILQVEQDKITARKTLVSGLKTKLKGLGLTDEEITLIIS